MRTTLIRLSVILALLAAACGTEASPTGPTRVTQATPETTVATTASSTTVAGDTTTTGAGATTTTAATATAASEGGFPVTIDTSVGPVTIDEQPTQIVSFSPAATEILFAIGAGDQVIAVDSLSDFPTEAPTTDLSAYEPNVESIIELAPDLVVITFDPGALTDGLTAAGIPVITQFTAVSVEDAFLQYDQLGAATGHADEAAALVADMRATMDQLVADLPVLDEPITYYHELDSTLYSVTSATFIGELYGMLGLENVADPADDGSAFGYPQLSAEYLVDADPDFIFLADTKCCAVTAESLTERPGWDALSAVTEGRVVELDDDIASRWGPRMIDFMETVAAAIASFEPVQ